MVWGQILCPWLGDKVDSGIGLRSTVTWVAHSKCPGVDSEVDIKWGCSQLRHRVPTHHVSFWIQTLRGVTHTFFTDKCFHRSKQRSALTVLCIRVMIWFSRPWTQNVDLAIQSLQWRHLLFSSSDSFLNLSHFLTSQKSLAFIIKQQKSYR